MRVLIMASLALFASATRAQVAEEELTRRRTALVDGVERALTRPRLRSARSLLRRALRREPPNVWVPAYGALLADERCEARDAEDFRAHLERAERDPDTPRGARVLAIAHGKRCAGQHQEAFDHLASFAPPQHGPSASLLRVLAADAIRRGDLAFAEDALVLARRILPQSPEILHELASLWVVRGQPGRAVALLQTRLRLRPDDALTRRLLASALHAEGRTGEAIETFVALGEADDLLNGARAALEAGWPGRAAALARRALAASSEERGDVQLVLGLSLASAGQREGARRALRRACELMPDSLAARSALEALRPNGE